MPTYRDAWERIRAAFENIHIPEYERRDNEALKAHLNAIYGNHSRYNTKATLEFHVDDATTLKLTKCVDCRYCIKPRGKDYRCKYSANSGKPERETCNYERKKR